jgi:hypothetical protein
MTKNKSFFLDFADIQVQLSSLSDILEQIKTNTTTPSVSSKSIVEFPVFVF